MEEKRKSNLAVAALKIILRKRLAIRDIANLKREIGNIVKEPEMVAVGAKPEELLRLARISLREVLEQQMRAI